MSKTSIVLACAVALFVPSFCSVCEGDAASDPCSGTLPKSTPCVDNKLCTLQNCSTFIWSMSDVDRCMPDNAAPADHCVTLALQAPCGTRGLCKKEQLPNSEEQCLTGNGTAIIWVYPAEMGGSCVLP